MSDRQRWSIPGGVLALLPAMGMFAGPTRADDDPFFRQLKPPFGRGINLGNALEAPREGQWGVTLKEEYFAAIKAALAPK